VDALGFETVEVRHPVAVFHGFPAIFVIHGWARDVACDRTHRGNWFIDKLTD